MKNLRDLTGVAALRNLIEFAIHTALEGVWLPVYASEFYKRSGAEKLQGI